MAAIREILFSNARMNTYKYINNRVRFAIYIHNEIPYGMKVL